MPSDELHESTRKSDGPFCEDTSFAERRFQSDAETENQVSPDRRVPRIVASLTSYPERIDAIAPVLESLLAQTHKPDLLILWLSLDQFPSELADLPSNILSFRKRGVDIRFRSGDLRSHKKYRYVLEEYPEDILITFDDDIIYPRDAVEVLWHSYLKHPDCVSALRVHHMRFDEAGYPLPYCEWGFESSEYVDEPRMDLFATTGAGTLFPPHCMHDAALDDEGAMECCPNADDVWLKLMQTMAGTPVVLSEEQRGIKTIAETAHTGLWRGNVRKGGNDAQMMKAIDYCAKHFGFDESQFEASLPVPSAHSAPMHPAVSVVVPVYDVGPSIRKCIDSLRGQTLSNLELLFVDDCGSDGSFRLVERHAVIDSRIRIIRNECNLGAGPSRNAGLEAARGEYVAFVDPDDYVSLDFVELLYAKASENDVDIAKSSCSKGNARSSKKLAEGRTNRAIQSGLVAGRPLYSLFINEHWSAIYRRELLMSRGLRYGTSRNAQDTTFLLRVCSVASSIALEPRAIYHYVERPGSAIKRFDVRRLESEAKFLEEAIDCFLENNHEGKDAIEYINQRIRTILASGLIMSATILTEQDARQFLDKIRNQLLRLPWVDDLRRYNHYLEALIDYGVDLCPTAQAVGAPKDLVLQGRVQLVSNWAGFLETHPDLADSSAEFVIDAIERTLRMELAVEECGLVQVADCGKGAFPPLLRELVKQLSKACPTVRERGTLRAFVDHGVNLYTVLKDDPLESAAAFTGTAERWLEFLEDLHEPETQYMNGARNAVRRALKAQLSLTAREGMEQEADGYLRLLAEVVATSRHASAFARMGDDMRALIECGANLYAPPIQGDSVEQLEAHKDAVERWTAFIAEDPARCKRYGKGLCRKVSMMLSCEDAVFGIKANDDIES